MNAEPISATTYARASPIPPPEISPDRMVDLFIELRRGAAPCIPSQFETDLETEVEQLLLRRLYAILSVEGVTITEVAPDDGPKP